MQAADVSNVMVIGAGAMGHGIAQNFAQAGYSVFLQDINEEKLRDAINKVRHNLTELAALGILDGRQIQPTLERIHPTTCLEDASADADLVIEAVFEDLVLKRDLFRELDRVCPAHAILASNTSSFMPSALAVVTNRPDQVLVTHHFYPAHLLPLVEIVRGEATSDETVDTVYDVMQTVGKSPIVVQKEAIGFIANRLQIALLREALHIVERGIGTPQDVDIAVKESFGRRLAFAGPFEMEEIQAGWGLMLTIVKVILPDLSTSPEPPPALVRQVEKGDLGPQTGKGFYEWTPDAVASWNHDLVKNLIALAGIRGAGVSTD
jgi:3-hydroxybutyryl-CoA dehydrogenase